MFIQKSKHTLPAAATKIYRGLDQTCKSAMTYPISQMRRDYFLAREIRKKVNLLSEDLQLVRVSPGTV